MSELCYSRRCCFVFLTGWSDSYLYVSINPEAKSQLVLRCSSGGAAAHFLHGHVLLIITGLTFRIILYWYYKYIAEVSVWWPMVLKVSGMVMPQEGCGLDTQTGLSVCGSDARLCL